MMDKEQILQDPDLVPKLNLSKDKSNLTFYRDILKTRFLTTDEACAILEQLNHQAVNIPEEIYRKSQCEQPPASGEFLVFDYNCKAWKKDKHSYQTRKVSNAV